MWWQSHEPFRLLWARGLLCSPNSVAGYERHQQGSSLPMREAHDSFAPSNRSERDRQQRPLKRPRDVDVEGNSRSQRRGVSGPPSLAPPPPPRQAGLPPPPPVPSSAANGSTQQVSNRSDEHRSNKDESSQQGSSARRRRTGWEPAKSTPQPVHPAEALRSMPMPETREGGSGVGMSNHDLPGPPPMMPPPGQGPPPPAQPPAKDFGLSGVLAAETKRNEGGHIQKYAEPADAAIPGPGWRLYVYKGAYSSTSAVHTESEQPCMLICTEHSAPRCHAVASVGICDRWCAVESMYQVHILCSLVEKCEILYC